MARENRVTIKIPRPLYTRLSKVTENSGFSSVTGFVIYVLRDLISVKTKGQENESLTKKEVSVIRERLKNLGYF